MNPYALLESDELAFENELESYDDALLDSTDLEFDERKRGRSRKPGRVQAGRTPEGRDYVTPRPNGTYATQAQLQAGLARVGKDIREHGLLLKNVTAQVNKVTSDIGSVNTRQDAEIVALRKGVKKVDESGKNQAQLAMLMMLLQKSPELEAKPNLTDDQKDAAEATLEVIQPKKTDNTLPLIMMMMATSSSGGGSDNSMNMMLPLILLLDK